VSAYAGGSANANEAQVARDRLLRLLAKLGLTWNEDPSNLWLTIHESIAHPTELDRAMGYEANRWH
jgi:predicted Zn-dependent protease